MRKKLLLLFSLLVGLTILNLYGYGNYANADTSQLEGFSISGTCEGVTNAHLTENIDLDWLGLDNYTYMWDNNISQSIPGFDAEALQRLNQRDN